MVFSIKNGLIMAWFHLHDVNMLIAFGLFALPSVVLLYKWGFFPAIVWLTLEIFFIIFVRCFDDPIKLGYGGVDKNA